MTRSYLDSLQWLGEQIVADPRFAPATVRFWWPAIYGSEPLVAPTNPSALDYQGQLNAFNAQEVEIGEIARALKCQDTTPGRSLRIW